ncbi:E3 ubiquitin-protein ligase TRIM71 [Orchesella cincta]|uniref:E3 ubiquitin-protein ligase TRIM71 n=1 Tax=Orchesella cincta TaxID=48709 RepID=A0A1D2ME46_ORCCI|nr:E3 ubiquitin-protein ligase TRIM71 [Orchesella cincta]
MGSQESPSFRDVVAGTSTQLPSQLKDIAPSEFVEQVALFQPNLQIIQQGAVGNWLLEQYLEDQLQFPFQSPSLLDIASSRSPEIHPIPYYEELGLHPSDLGRSSRVWSPSTWMLENLYEGSTSATAVENKWERYQPNPNMNEGSWTPWQSKDFFAIFLAEQRNERLAASLPAQTVTAGPSTSQQPRSGLNYLNTLAIPEEKVVKLQPLPEMVLNVTSKQHVNFTHTAVQFQIEVENVPAKLPVGSDMIEANAFAPSGEGYQCAIRKEKRKARTFSGHFRTREETGFYELHVRLNVPKREFWGNARDGAVNGMVKLFVSKNYLVDSQHSNSFKCADEPTYGLPSLMGNMGYTKVWGLTCDTFTNHIYYSDRATNKIYCVDPEGREIASFGQPTEPGMVGVNRPTGLAFDSIHRRLVVADKDNHRISLFTPGGHYINSFGSLGHANGEFNYPWDVAVSPVDGKIAVTDAKNKRLQLFGRVGEFIEKYSAYEKTPLENKTKLDFPRACSFDAEGKHLYVTDFQVQNVLKLTTDMQSCRKMIPDAEKRLRRPQGIAVDNHGNLLVADSMNDSIRFMDREGELLCSIFSLSNRPLEFPVNLTNLAHGKLAVLDGKGTIHIF